MEDEALERLSREIEAAGAADRADEEFEQITRPVGREQGQEDENRRRGRAAELYVWFKSRARELATRHADHLEATWPTSTSVAQDLVSIRWRHDPQRDALVWFNRGLGWIDIRRKHPGRRAQIESFDPGQEDAEEVLDELLL
jgi:hypothetical protein